MTEPAWLFDAYPHPRTSHVVVWIKHGPRVLKRLVPYQPAFTVSPDVDALDVAERILATDKRVLRVWRDHARLRLRGDLEPVLRVQPRRLQDLHVVANDLRRRTRTVGFHFYDVDNSIPSRWAHENGLFLMCRLHVDQDGPVLRVAAGEDRWTHQYPQPDLSTSLLRVEADAAGFLRRVHFAGHDLHAEDVAGERQLLVGLGQLVHRVDPDVILTHGGDGHDVPLLLRRIRHHGLQAQVRLGRDVDPHPDHPDQRETSLHTYGRWLHKTGAYYLRGRWHLDLSKRALDSEDERSLYGIVYVSRLGNRRPQDANRNGAGYILQQMQVDAATDQDVAIPWRRNSGEGWTDAATLCAADRGGQFMVPVPGLYFDVAGLDFSGFYPHLIAKHNLSSETINCPCCPDGELVPGLGYHVGHHRGHQAKVLARVLPHRAWAKATLRRSTARKDVAPDVVAFAKAVKSEQKAVGVTCFGYFRYRNARFGSGEVHQSIQAHGRAAMAQAHRVAQEADFDMIHCIVDGALFQRPGITVEDARALARRITHHIGVPFEVEGVYRWVVLLPSKTHSTTSPVGAPTRYYGARLDGSLRVRGVEVRQHSTPAFVRDVQQRMLEVLARARDEAEFYELIPHALAVARRAADELLARRVEPAQLAVQAQATRAVEDYAAATNVREALHALRDGGLELRPGQYVQYVVTRRTGARRGRVAPAGASGLSWFAGGESYSVEHYARLLARSVESILSPFGYNEDDVLAWLAGRARRPLRRPPADLPLRGR